MSFNFGIDDVLNHTTFGIPNEELKPEIEKLRSELSNKESEKE